MAEPSMPPLHGVVLCGGRGTRMGEDKGLLPVAGVALSERIAALLAGHCARVSLSIRPEQEGAYRSLGRPFVIDRMENCGPVAGVLAAFSATPRDALLVVACDMPFVDDVLIAKLAAARALEYDAIAYRGEDGAPEPLCAVYEPAMAAVLTQRHGAGDTSLRRALSVCDGLLLERPMGDALTNANTREDYGRAVRVLETDS